MGIALTLPTESSPAPNRVEQTHAAVKSGVAMVDCVLQQIAEIQETMKSVTDKTREIRDSASEQSRATASMSLAAERMSTQAQEEDAEIQKAGAVIADLERLTKELRSVVGSFQL